MPHLITQVRSASTSLMFGPLPTAATISHLVAVTDNSVANQTVAVLDDVAVTPLACATTVSPFDSCSNDTDSVSIAAGHFVQVRVSNGAGSWRVTFQLG